MNVDYKITLPVVILGICMLLFPALGYFSFPLFAGKTTFVIEAIQAFMLCIFAVYTYMYMQPLELSKGQKQFWLWAVLWWLLLFGRSTSWGRDYFPEVPRIYFRAISVFFIAPVILLLGSRSLRQEIKSKFKHATVFVWPLILAILGLVIADGIERDRLIAPLFVYSAEYQDFLEELYEFPLILGLFLVTLPIMQQDKKLNKSP